MGKRVFWGYLVGLLGIITVLFEFGDCEFIRVLVFLFVWLFLVIFRYVEKGVEKYDLDIYLRLIFFSLY